MSITRRDPPPIDLGNLRPPYPARREKFFTDADDETKLRVDDAGHGFRHRTKEFALVNAWWLSEAAGLVYDEPDVVGRRFADAGLPHVAPFDSRDVYDTQCFVAHNDDLAVVAFRGTESDRRVGERSIEPIIRDILTDAKVKPTPFGDSGARVHRGFKGAVDSVWDGLAAHLAGLRAERPERAFWFTGHSLGAALATLAAARSAEIPGFTLHGLYTFGSPLVGNADFKTHFDGLLRKFDISYFRFANNQDIVTLVPGLLTKDFAPPAIRYGHVGTLKFIDHNGRVGDALSAMERVGNFFGSLLDRAANVFGRGRTLNERLIPGRLRDHVPMLYSTHIWNARAAEQ